MEAITSRKVQRTFAAQAVEAEKLGQIVSAGRHAMSARNLQPWQFIVIQNRDQLREIGALCSTGTLRGRRTVRDSRTEGRRQRALGRRRLRAGGAEHGDSGLGARSWHLLGGKFRCHEDCRDARSA
jgi:nitroreductase